jgi:NDP-4-keto-2,6-dideoxyhexose 3-C-methyltransferase
MSSYIEINGCRACGSENLSIVFDAGVQELTGRFPASITEELGSGPLKLLQCNPSSGCGLVQLAHTYNLAELYGENYGYRSGLNKDMVNHLHDHVRTILEMDILEPDATVVDIGSNDGTTLNAYPPNSYNLIGIDPSSAKFLRFYNEGITTICDFFSQHAVHNVFPGIKARVITSFSMFYDLEDPVKFALEVAALLDEKGVWVFEQSYLPEMLEANSFDTICHEHLEFYSLSSVEYILRRAGLRIMDVNFNDTNGGSFVVYACLKDAAHVSESDKIGSVLEKEKSIGLSDGSAFKHFSQRIESEMNKLLEFLVRQKEDKKVVKGLGASTKGNVLLQYYNIGPDLISEIGEVNPDKFGRFTPGTHIPIVPQDQLLQSKPDYLLVLPWHFRDFFCASSKFRDEKLVFPLPRFEIVDC